MLAVAGVGRKMHYSGFRSKEESRNRGLSLFVCCFIWQYVRAVLVKVFYIGGEIPFTHTHFSLTKVALKSTQNTKYWVFCLYHMKTFSFCPKFRGLIEFCMHRYA